MAKYKDYVTRNLFVGPLANILPAEFDADVATAFFAGGEKAVAEKFPNIVAHPVSSGRETAARDAETALLALDSPELLKPQGDALDTVPRPEAAGLRLETARSVLDRLSLSSPEILGGQVREPVSALGDELSGAGSKPSDTGSDKDNGEDPGGDKDKTKEEATATTKSEINLGSTEPNVYVSGRGTKDTGYVTVYNDAFIFA